MVTTAYLRGMEYTLFKKQPCRPVEFKGQGPSQIWVGEVSG